MFYNIGPGRLSYKPYFIVTYSFELWASEFNILGWFIVGCKYLQTANTLAYFAELWITLNKTL